MKLGILTQPLYCNYGGLLQAWALQQTLTRLGHEAWIIRRVGPRFRDLSLPHRLFSYSYHSLMIALGREKKPLTLTEEQTSIIRRNTNKFVDNRYNNLTPLIYTQKALTKYVNENPFEGYVVGSDQVWRPAYSPHLSNYFLDFAENQPNVRRIAYAASFGVDYWDFNEKDTEIAKRLAPMFDLMTVREDSGVKLLKVYLNVEGRHVLDPTMLMDKSDFEQLVNDTTCALKDSDGELFCYVLDPAKKVKDVIEAYVKDSLNKPYYCCAIRLARSEEDLNHIEECVMPPVEQWIKSFMDAKMVITDSFHGTVFSIIFNKPFWVVVNEDRGTARFTSLLSLFGLEDRIVTPQSIPDWNAPIDWTAVNDRREELCKMSKSLLSNSLISSSGTPMTFEGGEGCGV